MKYVALLSGGKDSCYNLSHCAQNGHELVAAASLGPELGKEELDSYMYQTVGQDAIEFVARALDVPLYRRVISGQAVEQGSEYGDRGNNKGVSGDETEDLFLLLSDVKSRHRDIQGVSVGAILSSYQRVRVEHVCSRLSLTPLCYLWQRDQGELLSEMVDAGVQAILIKVAGIGLTKDHLGKTLAEMQPTLKKLHALYGSHICGEGGEYETLTLDCPAFKHRIVLSEVETVIHSDSDFGTVAFLRIKQASLHPKETLGNVTVVKPALLEPRFTELQDHIQQFHTTVPSASPLNPQFAVNGSLPVEVCGIKRLGSWVSATNIQAQYHAVDAKFEQEVEECFALLKASLSKYGLTMQHCTNINVFLSSMDLFARMNSVYVKQFGISPPSRACVAVDLPNSIRIRMDCLAYVESGTPQQERHALHVQGLSYWAPANIGPYSQAVRIDERIWMSGQIGLMPASLEMPSPPSVALESALSFQHVQRITEVLRDGTGGGWQGHTQASVIWFKNFEDIPRVKKYYSAISVPHPTLFVAVKALPKAALIETQVLLHTGRVPIYDDDDDQPTIQPRDPVWQRTQLTCSNAPSFGLWESSVFEETGASCNLLCIRGVEWPSGYFSRPSTANLRAALAKTVSIRLFSRDIQTTAFPSLCSELWGSSTPPITDIPCRSISTSTEDDWDLAMLTFGAG